MAVEYTKLWKVLIDKRMKRTEMARRARISGNILAKLGKDEYVSLKSLEKICRTLDCDIGDIVSLKQNIDPALTDSYLYLCDSQWASSMNRVVFRYADVLLMRAEALAQLNQTTEAIALVNQVRNRAAGMATSSVVSNYPAKYGVRYYVGKYNGSYSKDEAMKIIKMERRLELAMESERFFDLVRWGDAATVLNKYYTSESEKMNFLSGSQFTANKNEYLPVPWEQMAASNGHYTQNCGQW